jgi:hypothetical protein
MNNTTKTLIKAKEINVESFVFDILMWVTFEEHEYNRAIFGAYGLEIKSHLMVIDVRETKTSDVVTTHPQHITILLPNGNPHEFSGHFFRPLGYRPC